MVYFIYAQNSEKIKIGYTEDITARFANIQTCCPEELSLLVTAEGGEALEQKLHRKFKHLRVHGEWFKSDDAIWKLIFELRETGGHMKNTPVVESLDLVERIKKRAEKRKEKNDRWRDYQREHMRMKREK
jgi:DNA polymerase IIIc chi subunit